MIYHASDPKLINIESSTNEASRFLVNVTFPDPFSASSVKDENDEACLHVDTKVLVSYSNIDLCL
jgi:hypothetical protein